MRTLHDSFQRRFSYLRLSITDICNFRCVYCLPNGNIKHQEKQSPLSVGEIKNLVAGFAELGFSKVRITGGEPTTRSDIIEVISTVKKIPGISQVALSTNGYRLEELAKDLQKAGVSRVNVSLDSLNENRFLQMTGKASLKKILAGIQQALELGYHAVKINAVLMKENHAPDFDAFVSFAKTNPVTIRFIELMQTGSNLALFKQAHIPATIIQKKLQDTGWRLVPREADAGPANEFEHPDYKGRIGIIAPYSKDFCTSCNRLRVSSHGGLKLCLFGDREYDLRPFIQHERERSALISQIQTLIQYKTSSHFLHEGNSGNTTHFAIIGG